MEPITRLYRNCIEGNNEAVEKMLSVLEITLNYKDKDIKGMEKMKVVF